MTELVCPGCGGAKWFEIDERFHQCDACGLCGPRDVLEALAAGLAPAGVLAEAERLLRSVHAMDVFFQKEGPRDVVIVAPHPGDEPGEWREGYGPTLADAYAKLKEARHG